jgi:hypothetical protein
VDEGPLFDTEARLDRASEEPSIYLEYDKAAAGLRYEVEWAGALGAASWTTSGVSAEIYRPDSGRHARGVALPPDERTRFLRLSVRDASP